MLFLIKFSSNSSSSRDWKCKTESYISRVQWCKLLIIYCVAYPSNGNIRICMFLLFCPAQTQHRIKELEWHPVDKDEEEKKKAAEAASTR